MGDATGIQWTDATWNPARGCSRVSDGCRECFAMKQAHRFSGAGQPYDGLTTIRRGKVDWVGKARLHPEVLDRPLRWKKPRRIFVNSMSDLFHESLSNEEIAAVFGVMAAAPRHTFQVLTKRPKRMLAWFEWVSKEFAQLEADVGEAMPGTSSVEGTGCVMLANQRMHPFIPAGQPGNQESLLESLKFMKACERAPWPLPNVHLGVSVEDQRAADERIPLLLQTPAAVRFISAEPLLERVALGHLTKRSTIHMSLSVEGALRNPRTWLQDACRDENGNLLTVAEAVAELKRLQAEGVKVVPLGSCDTFDDQTGCPGHHEPRIDWVIVGGESGPGARPCNVEWIRVIVRDCQRAGVPVFVKQLGAHYVDERNGIGGFQARPPADMGITIRHLASKKGDDPSEWPEDLLVRELPEARHG